jgi:hypothetical protein
MQLKSLAVETACKTWAGRPNPLPGRQLPLAVKSQHRLLQEVRRVPRHAPESQLCCAVTYRTPDGY